MRLCLLTNQDLDADPFVDEEPPCDPRPYLPEATWHVATLKKATAVEQVTRLVREGFDLFFNLCDGAADDARRLGKAKRQPCLRAGSPSISASVPSMAAAQIS